MTADGIHDCTVSAHATDKIDITFTYLSIRIRNNLSDRDRYSALEFYYRIEVYLSYR